MDFFFQVSSSLWIVLSDLLGSQLKKKKQNVFLHFQHFYTLDLFFKNKLSLYNFSNCKLICPYYPN